MTLSAAGLRYFKYDRVGNTVPNHELNPFSSQYLSAREVGFHDSFLLSLSVPEEKQESVLCWFLEGVEGLLWLLVVYLGVLLLASVH